MHKRDADRGGELEHTKRVCVYWGTGTFLEETRHQRI